MDLIVAFLSVIIITTVALAIFAPDLIAAGIGFMVDVLLGGFIKSLSSVFNLDAPVSMAARIVCILIGMGFLAFTYLMFI